MMKVNTIWPCGKVTLDHKIISDSLSHAKVHSVQLVIIIPTQHFRAFNMHSQLTTYSEQ